MEDSSKWNLASFQMTDEHQIEPNSTQIQYFSQMKMDF
jgi:hypothetical protein